MVNVSGWDELLNGSFILASTVMYQSYYGDWYITLLFIAFKVLLYMATQSPILSFITTMIFISVFYNQLSLTLHATIISIAVIEMSMVFYSIYFKKK